MSGMSNEARHVVNQLRESLHDIYSPEEALAVAYAAFEEVTGLSRLDLVKNPGIILDEVTMDRVDRIREQLRSGMPLQYVTGKVLFSDLSLVVDENVLIPRPETEELVSWVIETLGNNFVGSILDIGTGSGCIAVALASKLLSDRIEGLDISARAIEIARDNAARASVDIRFHRADILHEQDWERLGGYSVIVSNPPYVRESEKSMMQDHVLLHEPHDALFVTDEDPLIFYEKILDFAVGHLEAHGHLFFEINEAMADELKFLIGRYPVSSFTLKKDLNGRYRFLHLVF